MCAGDGGQLLPTGLGWGKILKIKIEARRPEEGRMSVYEGQIKGGRATEETVKSAQRMGEPEEAPRAPLCGALKGGAVRRLGLSPPRRGGGWTLGPQRLASYCTSVRSG